MRCRKCGERTEVLETVQKGGLTRRRRRCMCPGCGCRFTTTEVANDTAREVGVGEVEIRLGKLDAAAIRRAGYDPEALAAALAVDRRRDDIRRRQKAESRREQYEDEDRAPAYLQSDRLHRELYGF